MKCHYVHLGILLGINLKVSNIEIMRGTDADNINKKKRNDFMHLVDYFEP